MLGRDQWTRDPSINKTSYFTLGFMLKIADLQAEIKASHGG